MASDIVWLCVRNNSSSLIKRDGVQFSTEANNLTGRNSQKYSGLSHRKTIAISSSDKAIVLTKKPVGATKSRKPNAKVTVTLKRNIARVAKSIKNATSGFRSDLTRAALARASALFRANRAKATGVKPAKVTKKRHAKKTKTAKKATA